MQKIMTKYPVKGTSALQMASQALPTESVRIIEFPKNVASPSRCMIEKETSRSVEVTSVRPYANSLRHELAASLHKDALVGQSFNRMTSAQALIGGIILTAFALCSLLIGA